MSAAPAPDLHPPEAAAPAEASASAVLVVDDEELLLASLGGLLGANGYRVVLESDPRRALERLREETFAVVLSDQRMPGLSGLEFLALAREIQPHATRILITGVLNLDTAIAAINEGEIYRLLVKPWLTEELLMSTRNAAERHRLHRQNEALRRQAERAGGELREQLRLERERRLAAQAVGQPARRDFDAALEVSVAGLECYLPRLGRQSRRARRLCAGMAEVLALAALERQILEAAARLHDIGLLVFPRMVIQQWWTPGALLPPRDFDALRNHPVLGQEMARFHPPLDEIGRLIRWHHERWDGDGWPDGLAGAEIPWLARLLAVAAAAAEEGLEAVELIQRGAGTAFDPEAARICLAALAELGKEPELQAGGTATERRIGAPAPPGASPQEFENRYRHPVLEPMRFADYG